MTKIVINKCYGGFRLSQEACEWLYERGFKYITKNEEYDDGEPDSIINVKYYEDVYSIPRHHPLLVACVEELGNRSWGICSRLFIEEIDCELYRIVQYDGLEDIETLSTIEWINVRDNID